MDEYNSNSHNKDIVSNGSSEEKKIAPVISGNASVQKKTGFGRILGSIVASSAEEMSEWFKEEMLLPWIKKGIWDLFTNGIDMLVYGKGGSKRSSSNISKVSYNTISSSKSYKSDGERGSRSSIFDYDTIVFDNRGDAEAVLASMDELIDQFGLATIADFYELANVDSPSYTANDYGWKNLKSAQILRCRDGYIIKMPKASPIN